MASSSRRQLVVVALPSPFDQVRKISSEKEPHLTLLYLGDVDLTNDQLTHVTEYIEHASTFLNQFSLEVKGRGELGDSKADVIFFDTKWSKQIEAFRSQLLKDPLISTAFQSSEQFDGWVPHLTLGFPASPAKKDLSEYPSNYESVYFDRVALWTGEFSGPTFQLKPYDSEVAIAMSQFKPAGPAVDVGSFLTHHGVKGMKWGVRKDGSSSGGSSADSRAASTAIARINSAGSTRVLSNAELQTAITRMNLENQYKNLTSSHKNEIDQGLATAKRIIKVGKTVEEVRKFMGTPTGKAVKAGLSAAFLAAKVAASMHTGGASAAAATGAALAVKRTANHFTNVG